VSWDIDLIDDRGHVEGEWNYTHNTSRMIYDALETVGYRFDEPTWYSHLNGKSGPEGAAYLDVIIRHLEAEPAKYEAMNPENGWGSYDTLVPVLRSMRAAVPEWPCSWEASG